MNEDLVSVIMPAFNSERYIVESIESILNQTYRNIELLITDDGSEDNTISIIKSYAQKDSRVKAFFLKGNTGAGSARNNSIKHAKGRYIAFCDSDDVWLPEKLEKQIRFMQEKNCCFAFASYYVFDSESRKKGIVLAPSSVSLIDTKRDDKIGFLTAVYDTSFTESFICPPCASVRTGRTCFRYCRNAATHILSASLWLITDVQKDLSRTISFR